MPALNFFRVLAAPARRFMIGRKVEKGEISQSTRKRIEQLRDPNFPIFPEPTSLLAKTLAESGRTITYTLMSRPDSF
jgi:hypothetical protein